MELVSPLFVNTIAVIAMICGVALAAWLCIALFVIPNRSSEKEMPEVELPGHIHERAAGAPIAVILVIVFLAMYMIGYILYIWLGGVTY